MPYLVNPRGATPNVIPAYQGSQTDTIIQLAAQTGASIASMFSSSTTLSSAVWEGQSQPTLASPAVAWYTAGSTQTGYDVGQVVISPNAGNLMYLNPAGQYRVLIYATTGGEQVVAADCKLDVLAAPGFTSPTPPDLCTYDYCLGLLGSAFTLTQGQIDAMPLLITEASTLIRKEMGQRDFTRKTYSEEYNIQLDGTIYLKQLPVNSVKRIQGYQQTAMVITANSTQFATAFVQWITTGDWYSGTLTYTGISLISYQNGVETQTDFLFSNYPTITQLTSAVGAVSGWTAYTQGGLGSFGTITDLAMASTGTAQGAMDNDGCELLIYSEDLAVTRLDNAIGKVWTGRRRIGSAFGGRWGEDGGDLDDFDSPGIGVVRVTYDAGFNTIPEPVQMACVELVKVSFNQFRMNEMLKSETAGEYKYEVTPSMWMALPSQVRDRLAPYRIHRVN